MSYWNHKILMVDKLFILMISIYNYSIYYYLNILEKNFAKKQF